jgi:hypothetical protein
MAAFRLLRNAAPPSLLRRRSQHEEAKDPLFVELQFEAMKHRACNGWLEIVAFA